MQPPNLTSSLPTPYHTMYPTKRVRPSTVSKFLLLINTIHHDLNQRTSYATIPVEDLDQDERDILDAVQNTLGGLHRENAHRALLSYFDTRHNPLWASRCQAHNPTKLPDRENAGEIFDDIWLQAVKVEYTWIIRDSMDGAIERAVKDDEMVDLLEDFDWLSGEQAEKIIAARWERGDSVRINATQHVPCI